MRIDKFLKLSRIIKRRTIAKQACNERKVSINGSIADPSNNVKENDIIKVSLGARNITAKVLTIKEHVVKNEGSNLYEIITEDENQSNS